jgi:hypothetical protein
LGGVVLALAALLFLQYSIEHGLIPPIVRVAIGLLTGAGAIASSEALRKRHYRATANALAGAGIVVLYASIWAARALYELISAGMAFPLMILVTVVCGLLSWRHVAREIAVLGLVGGFATPILLSTGSDNPFGLFAYVLLLDCGLLVLARQRGWPVLMNLALLGTLFYQVGWILGRMGPERGWLGLLILGVFAFFFLWAGAWGFAGRTPSEREAWMARLTQGAGILLPFAFALYFAGNADLGPHLYPTALLLTILCAAAAWLGRVQQSKLLPLGAASAAVAVVVVWSLSTTLTTALAWEAAAIAVVLAGVFHGFVEWGLASSDEAVDTFSIPAFLSAFGFLLLLAILPIPARETLVWPWLCGWLVLAALLVRQSFVPDNASSQIAAAVGIGLGFGLFLAAREGELSFPPAALFVALAALACAAFHAVALSRQEDARRPADIAAGTAAMIVRFFHLPVAQPAFDGRLFLFSTLLFAFLAVLAATRMLSGLLYFAGMVLLAFTHLVWTLEAPSLGSRPVLTATALAIQTTAVLLLTFWPLLVGGAFLQRRWAVYAAALAGPFWFLPLRALYERLWGDETIGALPVVLGLLSLIAADQSRRLSGGVAGVPRSLVWFSAVALSFVALAIPLQLSNEWVTIGWALQGAALLALWKRLDHPGLKYFALALLAAVSVRLLLNPEVPLYHPRAGLPLLNWLAYTYLVPAACLLAGARILRGLEADRARPREAFLYRKGRCVGALACSMAAVLVVFAWINLTIFDYYSTGANLEISFERMAARDLTLSLAWAVYALVLLGIGFRRQSQGLRWVSLAFLVLTIGKVFLHDLGELEDLYRVGSLVGLALSLILVSLAYQRFVFRKRSSEEPR